MKYTIRKKLLCRTLYIQGMTCKNCESRIDKGLRKLKGVTYADAEYRRSKVLVVYDAGLTKSAEIRKAIEKLGYQVLPSPKRADREEFRRDFRRGYQKGEEENINLGLIVAIISVVYFFFVIFQNLGISFSLPQIDQTMGYGILFVVGLLTSLHCVAMCGGINLSQCVSAKFNMNTKNWDKFKPSILYNSGRVLSYTLIGGVAGELGSVISFSGQAKGIVAILAGIMMLIMGLNMFDVIPALRRFNPHMPKILSRFSGPNKDRGPLMVGLFNGLMPCGPLQAMQLYALGTGNMLEGAVSMFFFSLGTAPLMFGLGALSSFLNGRYMRKMLQTSAVFVVILGFMMFNRGLGLAGISPYASGNTTTAAIQGDIQTVTTALNSGRYTPITVQKGIPVRWTIKADEGELNSCNNPLTIPKYDYMKELQLGTNVIEFTPQEEGTIAYSCWMGMIRSTITVVGDISAPPAETGGSTRT